MTPDNKALCYNSRMGIRRSFSSVIAASIKQMADALKVSPECAVYLMSDVSLMRLERNGDKTPPSA